MGHPVLNTIFDFSRRGTNVMLCANHRPILNDVTHAELQLLLYRVSKISPVIANGLSTGRLTCFSSGQASPCLDLSRLNKVCVPQCVKTRDLRSFEEYFVKSIYSLIL